MKPFVLVFAAFTVVLLVGVTVFLILLLVGVIEVRFRPGDTLPNPPQHPEVPAAKARLVVLRGLRPKWEYLLFEGRNIIGRAEELPVEIDLQPHEPEDRLFSDLQHACITCKEGMLAIEDLGSANGTFVNRDKIPPGEKRTLKAEDVIHIGEVELKLLPLAPAAGPTPRLVVIRGLRLKQEHIILQGRNVIGRGDQKPVEIDIQNQEPDDRVWTSRQHACITRDKGGLVIEDLRTANGTYVNRRRVPPGTRCSLQDGDVIQIGEVQLQLVF